MPKAAVYILIALAILLSASDCETIPPILNETETQKEERTMPEKITKTDSEWKARLTKEQYYILRQKGTERPFTGKYHNSKAKGTYQCAGCGNDLFAADTKFDSGTGWPSFYKPISQKNIDTKIDKSLFTKRIEVLCARCGGHLGHVFNDGPKPTGQRYCINSKALNLKNKINNTPIK